MKVSLKEAQAIVQPKAGESFDPTLIPKAVKDAGFSPGPVKVTAVGTLIHQEDMLYLEMPGRLKRFVLAGGARDEALKEREELRGREIRLVGRLHPSHADKPPGLTVEEWEKVKGVQ